MIRLPKIVLVSALMMALTVGAAEGEVRGCSHTHGGLLVDHRTPFFMVDGVLIKTPSITIDGVRLDIVSGTWHETNANALVYPDGLELRSEEFLRVVVRCLGIEREGEFVGRSGIVVVTKSGAVGFMTSYLEDLAEAQEQYRKRNRRYAANLTVLGFFGSHPSLREIQMVGADGHWTATLQLEGQDTSCQVSGAIADGDLLELPAAGVTCQQSSA